MIMSVHNLTLEEVGLMIRQLRLTARDFSYGEGPWGSESVLSLVSQGGKALHWLTKGT